MPSDWISVTMPQAEQVGADQQRHLLGRELERAADDQRHGDGAGIHHQHMLQAERGQARPSGQFFVHRVDGQCVGHGASPRGVGSVAVGAGALSSAGAPASYQRLISARSSSVICVALFIGISFSTTACW